MFVGGFCLKEHHIMAEVGFWLPLWEVSFVQVQWQPHFTTKLSLPSLFICLTTFYYFYNQPQSLFAFISRERSEWAQCYSCDEKALSSRLPRFSLKIKVYKILSQPRDVWEIVLCFDVILSFSVTIQITDAKQTWLVIHSSKRKDGTLYKWSLELRRF